MTFLLGSLLAIPLLGALLCLWPRINVRVLLILTPLVVIITSALGITAIIAQRVNGELLGALAWLRLDALSAFNLMVLYMVFLLASLQIPGYFRPQYKQGTFNLRMARRFSMLWLGALTSMTLVLLSNNLGIMWVGIEGTTLVTAFLISTNRTPASLEATWKYLIICSVGVAFAFMGTMLVGLAAHNIIADGQPVLFWTNLRIHALELDATLMKIAFIFLLVGFGTKAGLAPMHSWLPDAHSQAPAPVSAIFSSFMLNAALYCIMRYLPLAEISLHYSRWALNLLAGLGIVSILLAAAFIVLQKDIKRLLAYCSIEHVGIIALGVSLGGAGAMAGLLHSLNHSLAKTLSFLAAGRLGQVYGSYEISKLAGSLRAEPWWGSALWGALLVLMGMAPLAIFMSEFMLLKAAAAEQAWWQLALFLAGATVVFISLARQAIIIAWGESSHKPLSAKTIALDKLIIVISLSALLLLGLYMPEALWDFLRDAAAIVGGAS